MARKKDNSADAATLAEAKLIRAKLTAKRRKEKIKKLLATTNSDSPLVSDRRYPIILADPPWRFQAPNSFSNRSVENHYPTMKFKDICALPVQDVATDDAVLLMWTTSAHLAKSLEVIEAWGFEYLSNLAWVKDRIGLGYYVRTKHELLLIAGRGARLTPEPADRPPSVLLAPRLAHSQKPVEIYDLIERMYPDFPKIELFARATRPGWDAWGNQV